MGNKRLPPGFRFHPTDVELVRYYLKRKVLGKKLHFEVIAELDIYKYAPWDLPDRSLMRTGDLKWYFFCPREKKYSSGSRTNRATKLGYWKTTGNDRTVHYKDEIVGKVKTLVFHRGKAPKGVRTDWVMYEYRLEEKDLLDRGVAQDAYVLCSIFKKDGPGPRNGAQYGAPFNEEDWDDDDVDGVEVVNVTEAVSCADMPAPTQPNNQNQSIVASLLSPEALPSTSNSVAVVADDQVASSEPLQGSIENDDIFAMLENFTVDSPSAIAPNDANEVDTLNQGEMAHNHNHVGNNEAAPWSDGFDIYEDLGDLGNLPGYNKPQGIISICHDFAYSMEEKFGAGNGGFLELMDLDDPLSCCSAGGYEIVQSDLHHIANHSSSVELVSGSSEFRMGDSFVENGNQGSFNFQASALPNTSANFCQTSEMGSGQTTEPIRRGEEQRNTFSILQYHLESVEDLMEVKRWKCRIFMSHDLGSSLRVKAEVTFRTRSTKDALSEKLEESLCITYGVCNLSKQEYLRFLIFICGMICPFLSDSQLVSYIFGSSDGTCSIVDAIIFYQLLDSLFWVKEVNWNFNSSVNNDMHLKFVMILHSLHFSV